MRLRRLEPVIRRALEGACRVPQGGRMLVAVSGGADSTALVVALAALAHERRLELHAAHLNHRLRGAASDADAAFVASLCARLGVPLHAASWDTRARMRRRALSGENGLRVLRREFLIATADRVGAAAIATAHTADDQLETLLLRLLRGTGLRGLGGMRPRAGRWIKPMLGATRAAIEADLGHARQTWRTDSSNADPSFTRNRIRHGVVAALVAAAEPPRATPGRIDSSAPASLRNAALPPRASTAARARLALRAADLATELRQAESALVRWTRPVARAALEPDGRTIRLPLAAYRRYPIAARRELIRSLWRRACGRRPGLTSAHLAQLDRLAAGARGPVRLPGDYSGVCERGWILVRSGRIQDNTGPAVRIHQTRPTPLPVPGCAERHGLSVRGQWISTKRALVGISENAGHEEYFAAEGICGCLEVRRSRAGETFIPFGRTRPVGLHEFLNKLPARSRTASPTVLADDSGILWVIGVRRSSRAPVQPGTRKVLCVHAERHD